MPPEFAGIEAESFSWAEETEISRIAQFDIGIMPLHDSPWERGKCAYKLLQYGAAGLPAVASPIGVNADVIGQLDGLAPAAADSWVDALLGVLQEPEARRRARGEVDGALLRDSKAATLAAIAD